MKGKRTEIYNPVTGTTYKVRLKVTNAGRKGSIIGKWKPKKCDHDWQEDEMFASGAVKIIAGSPRDMGEETRVVCQKCGKVDYVRVRDLGTIVEMYERAK